MVFDINAFDGTSRGRCEWDVKRLAASFGVAGRDNGFTDKQCRRVTLTAAETYRTAMRAFARQPILDVWYAHLNIEEALAEYRAALGGDVPKQQTARLTAAEAMLTRAHTRDALHALRKLTTVTGGRRRIVSDPPLIVPLDAMTGLAVDELDRKSVV